MRRRLFTFLSELSLLICVAALSVWAWAWAAAPREPLSWYTIKDRESYGVATEAHGMIAFLQREREAYGDRDPGDVQFDRWRLRYYRITSSGMRRWNLGLPYWAIAASTAALPLWWAASWARDRRRRRGGLCPACGYDLRATPGRCPECGRTVEAGRPADL